MTGGTLAYDFGDTAQTTPLLYMYTLGHDFIPPGIHAGGLRYHGMSPIVSALVRDKIVDPMQLPRRNVLPPVSCSQNRRHHPGAGDLSRHCRGNQRGHPRAGKPRTILFNFSGHGLIDMASYDKYYAGELFDYEYPAEAIAKSIAGLPSV
jgi:tryptophan synthase beta chain